MSTDYEQQNPTRRKETLLYNHETTKLRKVKQGLILFEVVFCAKKCCLIFNKHYVMNKEKELKFSTFSNWCLIEVFCQLHDLTTASRGHVLY